MPLAPPSLATAAPARPRADEAATANWRANRAALAETQPALVSQLDVAAAVDVTWLFGRDGSLTAQHPTGAWWAGCSVPTAAARAMLRTLSGAGTVACFLRPPTAAAVRVALDRLRPNQAIVALVPDVDAARVMLHCEDFTDDLRHHQLWLAVGGDWEADLAALLDEHDGLPIPCQFIRLTDGAEEAAEAIMPSAQRIFSEAAQRRAAEVARLQRNSSCVASTRVCVVAPTHFRLWDDAGFALAQLAGQLRWVHVDPDDPACAGPMALARAAAGCAAVVTANLARADLPDVVALSMPWVTWLTSPRVPTFAAAGPRDALLVADPDWRDAALAQDWPPSRVQVAAWPAPSAGACPDGPLLILANLPPLDPPRDVVEMSSHRLLWEAIAQELQRNPFVLGESAVAYLHARMEQLNIAAATLDQRRFIDELIAPAYARGLAEALKRSGLPLRLAGAGWNEVLSLASAAAGPIETREAFDTAVASAAALIHVWPTGGAHPIDHQGRPVIRGASGRDAFLNDAKRAAAGGLAAAAPAVAPSLSADLLERLAQAG